MQVQVRRTILKEVRKIGTLLSLEKAKEMIEAWQNQEPEAVKSFLYGRKIFEQLLQVPGCVGIRVFNGIDDNGQQALVFVPVGEKNQNILNYSVTTTEGIVVVEAPVADGGLKCPTYCPAPATDIESPAWETYIVDKQKGVTRIIADLGELISRKKAMEMVEKWQSEEPEGIKSVLYGREIFDQLLAVPGCEGIRVFNAYDDNAMQTFVFVAVDGRNNNIREYKSLDGKETIKAPIADGGLRCPSYCPNPDSPTPVPGWEDYIINE
ncbi:hypothetical protein [Longitalea luteola]|uniref:hypothetical protein n=1 Tax=Longitalea luteola TaxID=2812563 RepID=UPI001A968EE4|nr:hypothetical protein [Longitalea luteola]